MSGLPPAPEKITLSRIAAAFATLTTRECEVLLWVFRCQRDSGIAIRLRISTRTVSAHVRNILRKLSVETRLAAAMEVARVLLFRRPQGSGG